jgi:hypothetical protein
MMHQQVALADDGEDVGLSLLSPSSCRRVRDHRLPGRILERRLWRQVASWKRPVRSSSPATSTSSGRRHSARARGAAVVFRHRLSTSSRTTAAKRRSRSSAEIISSRSSASSSSRRTSALRVTRKGWTLSTSMPGKSSSICAATSCSMGMKCACSSPAASSLTASRRGRGSLMRAKVRRAVCDCAAPPPATG